jgi:hypothetical protein
MNCMEKTRLLGEYEITAATFAAAVTELHSKTPVSPKADYQKLKLAAERARLASEMARLALEQHTSSHHC